MSQPSQGNSMILRSAIDQELEQLASSSSEPDVQSDAPPVAASLHPVLQDALDCLDVSLNDEIARYRRYRALQPPTVQPVAEVSPFPLDEEAGIVELGGQDDEPQEGLVAVTALAEESSPALAVVAVGANATAVSPGPIPPDDYLESSEELLRSLAEEEERAAAIAAETETDETAQTSVLSTLLTPLGVGSILLMILSSATLGYLVLRPSTTTALRNWFAADQTASSAEGEASGLSNLAPDLAAGEFDPLRPSHLSSLPSNQGIVSRQLADELLAEAFPEGTDTAVSPDGTVAGETGNAAPTITTTPIAPLTAPVAPAAPPSRPARTVPRPPQVRSAPPPTPRVQPVPIRPAPAPAPAAEAPPEPVIEMADPVPAPAPAAPPVNTGQETPSSNAETGSSSNTSTPDNRSSGAPAAPSSSAADAPPQEDLYYVTTPYTGDQSLEEAKDAVSGSYVRNFPEGTQVQMGAFTDEAGAEALIQNLQDQGIPAEVYEPETEE